MVGRVVVLASGSGTNCEALMAACASGELDAEIVAVVTNRSKAGVLERARRFGVETRIVDHSGHDPQGRIEADQRLIEAIDEFEPDLVVLAGWMRILGAAVGSSFPIMNLHPALPGMFAGVNAIERAFGAFTNGEISESGAMVHWVPDDGVDVGPVISTATVPIYDDDTLASFEARMHETEHRLIVEGVRIALSSPPLTAS